LLTLSAYFLAITDFIKGTGLIIAFVTLGGIQAVIQLIFFLYLGNEPKPRQNLTIFLFMVLVLSIVIIGTLWIMHSLNHRTMSYMGM
jgi:cytochrome o ubiquinol oxidase operon protein cyoD